MRLVIALVLCGLVAASASVGPFDVEPVAFVQLNRVAFPFWEQQRSAWADYRMGESSTIGRAGCLSCSMAMGLKGYGVKLCAEQGCRECVALSSPKEFVAFFNANEGYSGNNMKMGEVASLSANKITHVRTEGKPSKEDVSRWLSEGYFIVAKVNRHLTSSRTTVETPSHFVLLTGVTEAGFRVNDPATQAGESFEGWQEDWVVRTDRFKVDTGACLIGNTQLEGVALTPVADGGAEGGSVSADTTQEAQPSARDASVASGEDVPGDDEAGKDAVPMYGPEGLLGCRGAHLPRGCCPCGPEETDAFFVCCKCDEEHLKFCRS